VFIGASRSVPDAEVSQRFPTVRTCTQLDNGEYQANTREKFACAFTENSHERMPIGWN
jgi:hypothetical protein